MEEVHWHSLKEKGVLDKLKTSLDGISEHEANLRLQRYGKNELEEKKGESLLSKFLSQFKEFLIIILIASAILSAFLGDINDAVAIGAIVIINSILAVAQQYRAEKAIQALKKISAPMAKVVRGGKAMEVPANTLVPGDIIILDSGDKVPADSRLLEVSYLGIDEASLTGESTPVNKSITIMSPTVPVSDRGNMVWFGTSVVRGRGKAVIVGTGMGTEFGKIAQLVQEVKEEQTPLQERLEHFGKQVGVLILGICVIVSIAGIIRGNPFVEMILSGVSLAVAAIPEGLPAIVTITLAFGTQKMARRNAIVRELSAVETLGSTNVICSDKTGTLTKNQMTVSEIYVSGKAVQVTGAGYEPHGEFSESPSRNKDLGLILKIGALNNNSELLLEKDDSKYYRIIGDTTEGALIVAAAKAGFNVEKLRDEYTRVHEFPFDPDRKRMSTIHKTSHSLEAYVKGAPELTLPLCTKILKDGKVFPLTKEEHMELIEVNRSMAARGLRVLLFAYKKLPEKYLLDQGEVESELIFVGLQGMIDPPRPEVKQAINLCRQAGIRTIIITGDHELTARAIAQQIGLLGPNDPSLTGKDLDNIPDSKLKEVVKTTSLFARVTPEHKMRIVNALIEMGQICAVTGDGVNDAPALKRANIGVAMGITGTDVAKESSKMVLADDNFATIVSAVEEGRRIYDNITKFIRYLLSANLTEVLTVFSATIFNTPLPLLPIHLLWINLVTDGLPALALGVDPASRHIMRMQPRNPKESILNLPMLSTIFTIGVIGTISTMFIFLVQLNTGNLIRARTMAFTTLVVFELFFVFLSRSTRELLHKVGIFTNPWLLVAVGSSLILQFMVVQLPFFQPFFSTTSLSIMDWCAVIMAAGLVVVFEELRKLLNLHY